MRHDTCKSTRKWLLGAATGMTVLMPAIAFAQTAAPADQAASTDTKGTGLGEIVVTATRRSESVQKVPISLQALTTEKLEQRQVVNFNDYVALLPSVSFASLGPGRSDLFFRGVAYDTGTGDSSALSTAGVYLDEIPMTTAGRMPEVHVYDMQRVEALSGPQGTLFGSSSLSGTLRLITNKPKLGVLEGGYDVELNKFSRAGNNFGTVDEGFINIPVAKNVAVRMMAYYDHTGGYIDNAPATYTYTEYDRNTQAAIGTYTISNSNSLPGNSVNNIAKRNANPVDEYGGRIAALAEFGDWTVTPQLIYQYLDAKGSFNFDPRFGDLTVHDFNQSEDRDGWYQAALTINGKVGDFDLVSSTGYMHRRIKNSNDYTYYSVAYNKPQYAQYQWFHDKNGNTLNPTQVYLGNNTYNKFTQEVRLSVPKSWPFSLTVGGFYQFQKKNINEQYAIPGLSSAVDAYGTSAGGATAGNTVSELLRGDAFYLTEVDRTYKDYALFSEGTYPITPELKLTGGIRLFRAINQSVGFDGTALAAAQEIGSGCATPFTAPRLQACNNVSFYTPAGTTELLPVPRYNQAGETHKASLSYQVRPDKMLYATYSTGFRPGGSNTIAPTQPFKADRLANYEVGFKTTWNHVFRLNMAGYFENWTGVQYIFVPQGFNGNNMIVNAGNAHIYGIEGDFDWKIGKFSLSGSGAYNDGKLSTNFCALEPGFRSTTLTTDCNTNPADVAAPKGTQLPRQPKLKGQMQLRYETQLGELGSFAQIAADHQSSSTSNLDPVKDALLGDAPPFTSFDFSAGVSHDKWNVEFFIENLFDERGQLSRNTFCAIEVCSASTRALPIKPRFLGLKFSNKF
ncbi:TonB-dependent receptor [Novosphingobium sp. FSW06-99]|uniref:TonB-dependent receptor n=1 Tax=Novosphingobium sp. FSW06-99 TaxID=1739113 RepID=UPI00076D150A|nr:TonB-dependent receptor [Novosphingobium sp. FSW06-99]KUR79821.1 TonB-dependent receptor [Novosphingobium sp. FSW06-99]